MCSHPPNRMSITVLLWFLFFGPLCLYAWSGPPNKLNLVTLLEAQFAAISLRLPRARPKSAVSGIRARIGRDGDGRTEQKRQRQQRKEVGRMDGRKTGRY